MQQHWHKLSLLVSGEKRKKRNMNSLVTEMTPELQLPGFRFHPTEEELLNFYLKNIVFGKKLHFDIIGFLNIYHHDPWELPGCQRLERESGIFLCLETGSMEVEGGPNRTTQHGFWKATGSDRKIVSLSEPKRIIGLRKTLVFYEGRAPKGHKTDWVMNEYRLPDGCPLPKDIVLCKIYRKATSLKVLEQRAAMEEEMKPSFTSPSPQSPPFDTGSFSGQPDELMAPMSLPPHVMLKKEEREVSMVQDNYTEEIKAAAATHLQVPQGKINLPELQVPKMNMDWSQDPIWSQLSPWLQNFA